MAKTRLAVCIGDEEYQNRFVKCLMNHYENQFEVHSYSTVIELQNSDTQKEEVIIIGECGKEETEVFARKNKYILYLKEERETDFLMENVVFTTKYQEVFKIVDCIEKMTGTTIQTVDDAAFMGKKTKKIGVFSFNREHLQLAFSAALCGICGEQQSVLLLDLQPFSGLESEDTDSHGGEILSMEDLMAVSATGVYTKGRLLAGIGRGSNFEYVHGIKNPECFAEGSAGIYNTMIDMLVKELGYESVVINFGGVFSGMLEFMDTCDKCYLLVSKGEEANWRERIFREGLQKRGKTDFFRRVTRIEVPAVHNTDVEWQQLAEKWKWGEIGNFLREERWINGYREQIV